MKNFFSNIFQCLSFLISWQSEAFSFLQKDSCENNTLNDEIYNWWLLRGKIVLKMYCANIILLDLMANKATLNKKAWDLGSIQHTDCQLSWLFARKENVWFDIQIQWKLCSYHQGTKVLKASFCTPPPTKLCYNMLKRQEI